mgnify:CR=1 FL=1
MKKLLPRNWNVKRFFNTKYKEIILAVGLFVLLDTGVLIINFYTSYQIPKDAHAIQLASRMGTLTQQLFQELYQVRDDAVADGDYYGTIDIFAKTFKIFDETLDSFIYGGALIGEGQGQDALLEDTTYRDTNANTLKEAETIWKDYRVKLKPIVYAYFNDSEREDIIADSNSAIEHARQHNDKLRGLMDEFAKAVEGVAQRKAERLRLIQSVGMCLAIINFFLILFHFLRKLSQTDALLEKAQKENEDILKNVNEGLFLMDRDYLIGSQHSNSLHALFNQESFEDKNFLDLLTPLVTEKTLDVVKDYTDVLFSPKVNESLIGDLNPLNKVEINLTTDSAQFDIRYFSFQFSRVYDKGTFQYLLVTVKDITDQVELEEKLKTANEKASREIDMLLGIMHVENSQLKDFLDAATDGLDSVNNILKNPAQGADNLKGKLNTIFRIVHKTKGDSSALGIEFIEEKINSFENILTPLMDAKELSGESFLPLVVHLNKLMSDFKTISDLHEKIAGIVHPEAPPAVPQTMPEPRTAMRQSYEEDQLREQFSRLVTRVAHAHHKEVALDITHLDVSELGPELTSVVRDIAIQCLRNAVVHGLETPAEREKMGKSRQGTIRVSLIEQDSTYLLVIRDDGRGIDVEAIRRKAVTSGKISENQIARWNTPKVVSLIFRPGFSTSAASGLHAGRGVGLDIIKSRLDAIGGKIRVGYRLAHYTEFHFILEKTIELAKSA